VRSRASVKTFRADIQGIRAIAVTMVVLYHASWPLPGGFLGVDIFFVVSGFVISQMLLQQLETSGKLKFGTFFFRRFLRLAPALSVVSVVTVLALYFLVTPSSSHAETAKTAIAATLGVANVVIAQVSGGYFGSAPESNGLLHTWTLSVEEQFYVFLPFVLATLWALLGGNTKKKLGVLQILVWGFVFFSFSLSFLPVIFDLSWGQFLFGFYSPLTRAWEFSIGVAVYLLVRRFSLPHDLATVLGYIGVLLISVSVVVVSIENQAPGILTLLPTVGTGLLLAAGSRREGRLFEILSHRSIVTVGDFSYSIYLWHWPVIFVVSRIWPDNFMALQAGVAVSVGLASLSYRFVERPLRGFRNAAATKTLFLCLAVVMIPIAASSLLLHFQDRTWAWLDSTGLMSVAHSGEIGTMNTLTLLESRSVECVHWNLLVSENVDGDEPVRCRQSRPGAPAAVAVVGDSHGIALFTGLSEEWEDENLYFFSVNWGDRADLQTREKYDRELDNVLAILENDAGILHVIFTGYWAQRPYPPARLDNVVSRMRTSGKMVYFSDDIPDFEFGPERCKYGSSWVSRQGAVCEQPKEVSPIEKQNNLRSFVSWADGNPHVLLLETRAFFCGEESCTMISESGALLYGDDDHLNMNGARYLADNLISNYPNLLTR